VGLKRRRDDWKCEQRHEFQTNPRGVEALSLLVAKRLCVGFRRTLVGLKRPVRFIGGVRASFRRTLVGLKPPMYGNAESVIAFQTNPRGVEATVPTLKATTASSFRRTLVGLKHARRDRRRGRAQFQTNPRGVEAGAARPISRQRCKFQTNPRGVEAASGGWMVDFRCRVSDEPSWG
jgi:hypothetical protein